MSREKIDSELDRRWEAHLAESAGQQAAPEDSTSVPPSAAAEKTLSNHGHSVSAATAPETQASTALPQSREEAIKNYVARGEAHFIEDAEIRANKPQIADLRPVEELEREHADYLKHLEDNARAMADNKGNLHIERDGVPEILHPNQLENHFEDTLHNYRLQTGAYEFQHPPRKRPQPMGMESSHPAQMESPLPVRGSWVESLAKVKNGVAKRLQKNFGPQASHGQQLFSTGFTSLGGILGIDAAVGIIAPETVPVMQEDGTLKNVRSHSVKRELAELGIGSSLIAAGMLINIEGKGRS